MTILALGSEVCYLTETDGLQWRDNDYRARAIVKGLKQEPFEGYARFTVDGKSRNFTTKDIEEFVPIFLRRLGRKVRAHLKGPLTLVPVPNSGMVMNAGGPFRIVELAEMLAAGCGPGDGVAPALRWASRRDKAHLRGGQRSPEQHQPHLRLDVMPRGQLVLFDDVRTSGSQMIAAARVLAANGNPPIFGFTVARATKVQHPQTFEWLIDELDY